MLLSLIVAMDSNGLIGADGRLPWQLPADLRHFKETTIGKPIAMGRKTYASIGHALPDRTNIIITRDTGLNASDSLVVHSIDDAIRTAAEQGAQEMIFIGGAAIYKQIITRVERIYLTRIHHQFSGDTRFPEFDEMMWSVVDREDHRADDTNPYDYTFLLMEPAHDF